MTRIESRPAWSLWWLAFLVLAAVVVLPGLTVALQNRLDSNEAYFIENVVRRREAAARMRAGGPRILIVGGSSSLFGLDAEWMERSLGKPVVNMGSHAGLGLEYLLARSLRVAAPGDTVLLALEHHLLTVDRLASNTQTELDYVTTFDRRRWLEMSASRALPVLYGFKVEDYWLSLMRLERCRRIACVDPGAVYDFTLASPNGDFWRFPEQRRPLDEPNIASGVRENARRILRAYIEECLRRNVRLAVTLPAFAADEPERPAVERWLKGIEEQYRSAGLAVFEHAGEVLFPISEFTDTRYHPKPAIRRLKTARLIVRMGGRPAPRAARPAASDASEFRRANAGRLIVSCEHGMRSAPLAGGWIAEYRMACDGTRMSVNGHGYPRPESGQTLIAIDTAAGVIVDGASFDAAGRAAGWRLGEWLEDRR